MSIALPSFRDGAASDAPASMEATPAVDDATGGNSPAKGAARVRRGLFDAPFDDGTAPTKATAGRTPTASVPFSPTGSAPPKEMPVPSPNDDALARQALFLPRDPDIERTHAREVAIRLMAGCLQRTVLFDAVRSLPDPRALLIDDAIRRAFDVMCTLAEESPLTPRGFLARAREVGNQTADDGLDAVTAQIMRAPAGTRADLEELLARLQRERLITLGDRLARFGRIDHPRNRITQLLSEAEHELAAISALAKFVGQAAISVPMPQRGRQVRDPARWSTTIPNLDNATFGGIAPQSLWSIRGEGSGALALQIGLGLACLAGVSTRLISTRRTGDGLSTLFGQYVGPKSRLVDPPLTLHPVGEVVADGLIEEVVRAAQSGARLVVVEGLERVVGLNATHAERLVRIPSEEECALVLAGRSAQRLEEVYFELANSGDVHLELTPFGADAAIFVEATLADAATPKSARLPAHKDGFFEGRRPR